MIEVFPILIWPSFSTVRPGMAAFNSATRPAGSWVVWVGVDTGVGVVVVVVGVVV